MDKENVVIVADNKTEGKVNLVSDALEVKLTNNLKSPTKSSKKAKISVVKEEVTERPIKMVKILMKCDHKCYIGGEWYYLLEGKHYNVPENVKNTLMGADLLKPL